MHWFEEVFTEFLKGSLKGAFVWTLFLFELILKRVLELEFIWLFAVLVFKKWGPFILKGLFELDFIGFLAVLVFKKWGKFSLNELLDGFLTKWTLVELLGKVDKLLRVLVDGLLPFILIGIKEEALLLFKL